LPAIRVSLRECSKKAAKAVDADFKVPVVGAP
jgi:hypothetical protein